MKNGQSFVELEIERQIEQLIKVIGVGGAGSNAVNYMYRHNKLDNVNYIVCNTDSQALAASPVPVKIQIGKELTGGLGAGSKKETGQKAALENLEDIRQALGTKTKMLFITAGMGGGTGTGAAPEIAKLAKESGILTLGIVTMPFLYEGEKRRKQALEGIRSLRQYVDSLIVVENEKLVELYGDLGFTEAFAKSNEVLSNAVRSVITVITKNYLINLDFNDVETILKDSGTALFGLAEAAGEDRAQKVAAKTLESPLLNNNNIRGAKKILLLIRSGRKTATVGEISYINHFVRQAAGNDVELFMGLGVDNELGDKISVTVIATGFPENVQQGHITDEVPIIKHLITDHEAGVRNETVNADRLFDLPETEPKIIPEEANSEPEVDEFDQEWAHYKQYIEEKEKQNRPKKPEKSKQKTGQNKPGPDEPTLFDIHPEEPENNSNVATEIKTVNQPTYQSTDGEEHHIVRIFDREEDDMNVERYDALYREQQNQSVDGLERNANKKQSFTLEEIQTKPDWGFLSRYNYRFRNVKPGELKKEFFIRINNNGTVDLNDSHSYINRKLD